MRRAWVVPATAALLWACAGAARAGSPLSGDDEAMRDACEEKRREPFEPVERALRDGGAGPFTLERAVILMERTRPPLALRSGRGIEGGAEEEPAVQSSVYIMDFGAEGRAAGELEVMRLQRETLENQREMMRSVRALTGRHASLGAQSARIENRAREMVAGMASAQRDEDSLRGESAQTNLGASAAERRAARSARRMEKMAREVAEIEGKAKDLDIQIGRAGRGMRGGRISAKGKCGPCRPR